MSVFKNSKDKEQKLNELQLKIQKEKQKADKELTRQKILLGAFFGDMLTKDNIGNHVQYTIDNLEAFFTRKTDKEMANKIVRNIKETRQEAKKETKQTPPTQGNHNG